MFLLTQFVSRQLFVLCGIPNAELYSNHDMCTYDIMWMTAKQDSDCVSPALMAHSRHKSLKSQQAYQQNSAATNESFQASLSPIPLPPSNSHRKSTKRKATDEKANMKAPPPSVNLKKPILKNTSRGDIAGLRKSARIQKKKAQKKT